MSSSEHLSRVVTAAEEAAKAASYRKTEALAALLADAGFQFDPAQERRQLFNPATRVGVIVRQTDLVLTFPVPGAASGFGALELPGTANLHTTARAIQAISLISPGVPEPDQTENRA